MMLSSRFKAQGSRFSSSRAESFEPLKRILYPTKKGQLCTLHFVREQALLEPLWPPACVVHPKLERREAQLLAFNPGHQAQSQFARRANV